jgi:hypothetical protein
VLLAVFSFGIHETQNDINDIKKNAPKIFIDCRSCDMAYIKTEITFVNYVWDRREADVHILITTQQTGPGGREYTIAFLGQNGYKDFQNTLKYVAHRTDTEEERRVGLAKMLKMGLVSLAARTPVNEQLDVIFKKEVKATDVEDKWNFWVFSIGTHGFLNGQKTYRSMYLNGNVSANRVTPESKLRLSLSMNYDENIYEIEDEEIVSSSQGQHFRGLYVKSLDEHWSVGFYFEMMRSTYSNIDFALAPAPAVEYNIFPYSQSTRRQLRLLYRLGYNYSRYSEETIYDKIEEHLLKQILSVTFEIKEKWGTVTTSVTGSHYFHDAGKYNFRIFCDLSLRLYKGLRLNIFGSYSQVHDQLNLPKGEASFEEILLRRKELETSYRYFASIGLSYSFGSIFSNVVNPRFGNGRGGDIIIMH